MKIGIISDLHGTFDDHLAKFLAEVDEVWCAGDIGGEGEVLNGLRAMGKSVVAVWGNIDNHTLRLTYPEWQCFEREGTKVLMTHIGGYPRRYDHELWPKFRPLGPRFSWLVTLTFSRLSTTRSTTCSTSTPALPDSTDRTRSAPPFASKSTARRFAIWRFGSIPDDNHLPKIKYFIVSR